MKSYIGKHDIDYNIDLVSKTGTWKNNKGGSGEVKLISIN